MRLNYGSIKPYLVAGSAIAGGLVAWRLWRRREMPLQEPDEPLARLAFDQPAVRLVVPNGSLSGRYAVARTSRHVHRGIDISAPEGSTVTSPAPGTVVGVWPDCNRSGYGNNVLIRHPSGHLSFFAHLKQYDVARGDVLQAGDAVGQVGSTRCGINRAYMAPHLHYEVHLNMTGPAARPTINENLPDRIDPESFLETLWRSAGAAV